MPPLEFPRFSQRTAWNLTENELTRALAHARATGALPIDLTESNPTRCSIFDATPLVALLGHARGTTYEPEAFGHPEARAAVARYYEDRGAHVEPSRVVLSASTSEAYSWLFKLLLDRDDEVLVPQPSYPLFDFLATLEDARLVPYPLLRDEGFRVDLDQLRRQIGPRTRAVLLVHPNNPTGAFTRRDDAAAIDALAAEHGLAVVVDEVFADYPRGALPSDRLPSFADPSHERRALTFVMSGLSKVLALPQLKLGWTIMLGPDAAVDAASARLEIIADTFLSVGTPVARALPELLAARAPVQAALRTRTDENLAALDAALARLPEGAAVRRLPSDGGWYAILDVPRTRTEDEWALRLLEEARVVVHPGYFFELDREGYLVVSLITKPAEFAEGVDRLLQVIERG